MSRTIGSAAAIAFLLGGLAHAALLTPSQRKCQAAIASAGRQLVDQATSILADCSRDVAGGKLPPGTRCLMDAGVTQARSNAANTALQPLLRRCTDSDVAALAPAGDCRGATTVPALIACLHATHDA